MALDIHDWDEGGKSGQGGKEVPGEKEVFEGRTDENMDSLEGAEEVGADSPCAYDEEEEFLTNSVEGILEIRQALNGKNPEKEELSSADKSLEEIEANHADTGIEGALSVHESEVSGNLNSKVDSTAEECSSQDNLDETQCPKCNQICKDKYHLKNHLLSHYYHNFYRVTPDTKPFPCPTCGKNHRDRITLIRHFAFAHDMIFELTDITPEVLKVKLTNVKATIEDHEENEANPAEIDIEEAPEALTEHASEVSGNLNSKVKSSSAEVCCSHDEEESADITATTDADEMGGDMEKGNAVTVSGTVKTQAEELGSYLKISPRQFY